MNSFDMNKLLGILGKIDKNDLEKALSQANQIMNSENRDQIIDELKKKMQPKELTVQDIANVIENWTKIPVNKITEEETKKLLTKCSFCTAIDKIDTIIICSRG